MQMVITPSCIMINQQEAVCVAGVQVGGAACAVRHVRMGGAACVTRHQEMHRAPFSPSPPGSP